MKKKLPQLFSNKNNNNNRVPSRFGKKDKVDKKLKSNNLFGKFGNKNNKDNKKDNRPGNPITQNKFNFQSNPQDYSNNVGINGNVFNQNTQHPNTSVETENQVPINEYYQPMMSQNMTGETNIEGWANIKQIGVPNPYVENEKEDYIRNRKRPVQEEKRPGMISEGRNRFNNLSQNEYVNEVGNLSKQGLGKAEKFIVGDLQGVKRDKKVFDPLEQEDHRISISKDDYDNIYNVLPEKEIQYRTKKGLFGKTKQVPIKEKQDKKGFLKSNKLNRNENNKRKQKEEEREQTVQKNYQYLRKEIDGYSPLYRLDFLDKIRVTKRFLDEKSGRTARKAAKKLQEENRKKIEMQSTLKRKLTETLKPLLDKDIQLQRIEISLPKGEEDVCDYVLGQDYFSMFDIRKIEPNPNLKHYKVNVPILLEFKLTGREVEIGKNK